MSFLFEDWFWGQDGGKKYRRFDQTWLTYDIIQSFRVVSMFMFTGLLVAGFIYDTGIIDQFIYFTTWISYLSFASLILNYFAAEDQYLHPGEAKGAEKLLWRCALIVSQVALASDFVVTIIFWTLLFNGSFEPTLKFWYEFFIHILPLVFNFIDFSFSKFVWRLQHYFALLALCISYTLFNFFYVKATGSPIYGFLNWEDLGTGLFISGSIIGLGSFFWFKFYAISILYDTETSSISSQDVITEETRGRSQPILAKIDQENFIQDYQSQSIEYLIA